MSRKHPALERLAAGEVLLGGGAWGTELLQRGLAPGDPGEAWNASRPGDVRQVAEAYLAAGAEVISTNTFAGNRYRLMRHGLGAQATELNRAGARLTARAARAAGALAVGSVGPTGEYLAPHGLITEREAYLAFREQMEALQAGGIAVVQVETFTVLDELRAAVRAARDLGLVVFASMTFDADDAELRTRGGVTPPAAARALSELEVEALGANCGCGMREMARALRALRPYTRLPLLAYPNAGRPAERAGKVAFRQTPAQMAGGLEALLAAGAQLVGGCCGTTPAHIAALRDALAKRGLRR